MSAVKYIGLTIKDSINKNAIRVGVKTADISEAQNKISGFIRNSWQHMAWDLSYKDFEHFF